MADDQAAAPQQWAILFALTALFLSLLVLAQLLSTHALAYVAAPREAIQFLDALDSSVEENESYDRYLSRLPRLEDKVRLGRVLRDIQRGGDDLRELLSTQLASGGDLLDGGSTGDTPTTLKLGARLLWAGTRRDLEDRMRRLDMLRMRFLVVYMGVVAETASTTTANPDSRRPATPSPKRSRDSRSEKPSMVAVAASTIPTAPAPPKPPPLPTPHMLSRALTEELKSKRPPLRRLTTQAIGHSSHTKHNYRAGWAGVVEELQKSPRLRARHAAIERSIEAEMMEHTAETLIPHYR
ncbi:hypothetical protein F5X68DRAFT_55692 [Plectosphaerella plurivora]|uniref:Uncharacterized protein n=1 Tax=Plectosphaerella plurivora TaxID=936078 RepID=A0A9P8V279_9PEZI|nr:hypothetical protein F5X68DRAFT_55692 [Plectosphaerella plurivora]